MESPHEHQQNLLLSRIITNVEKLNEAVMVMNKALQEINIQNMDVELVAQMFKNYRSNVLFHLEAAPPPKMASSPSSPSLSSSASSSLFPPIPAPLQRLFDLVPLVTYPANTLPGDTEDDADSAAGRLDDGVHDTGSADDLPTLYVFINPADAVRGRASFNPTCLKWQTFLRFADIPVRVVASSNHASPTGALPFLQPARKRTTATSTARQPPPRPIPASDFPNYVSSSSSSSSTPPSTLRDHPRAAAYQALLDTSLRRAWLHAVYLDEARDGPGDGRDKGDRGSIAARLYAHAASSSSLVRAALASQLRAAAAAEVWGSQQQDVSSSATPAGTAQIYRDAEAALSALATILGGDDYFFGSTEPTLFDAAVFAYTHLLLEEDGNGGGNCDTACRFRWQNRVLPDMVRAQPQLVQHRNRIVAKYWAREGAHGNRKTSKKQTGGVADSVAWVKV
ncbi:hypothetical protein SCUCBS95973_005066 [Sporothrix curviconia]|uniref:DASH complex subunit DAD4 n=1 Tax=Sporothrix curviconia TaxID=1260050 RepID=A0ABP0BVE8_9PEZI